MKNLKISTACKTIWLVIIFLLLVAFPGNAAEIDEGMAKCAEIKEGATRLQCFDNFVGQKSTLAKCAEIKDDDTARLKCFNDLAKQETPLAECAKNEKDTDRLKCFDNFVGQKNPLAKCTEIKDDNTARLKCFDNLAKQETSVMSKHWDLYQDPTKEKSTFVLQYYRPNYFLPVAYNTSPNRDTALDFDPNAKAQYTEAKFQISFKVKPWGTDIECIEGIKGIDFWLAYTQLAFWQLYNSAFSSPFRETNYEPEFLVNLRTDYKILGFDGRFLNIGINHQSNGRSRPLSRSWNRIVANVGLERDNFNLLLKTWYRLPEEDLNDDNPDIIRYMGYGELWGTLYWKKQRFAMMLRNNLRSDNLGAVQLDWSFPLPWIGDKLSVYVQYFNGYGESLLDYNASVNRISAGLMLVDWN